MASPGFSVENPGKRCAFAASDAGNGGFPPRIGWSLVDAAESALLLSAPTWSADSPARHPHQRRGYPVNKQDLITAVAEAADLPKAKAGDVVDAVFEAIQKSLKKKQEVRLVGFGTFSTSKRKAGKGRNPRTGEEIKIPASTTVRFKAGKGLKDAVN
ncbi:HU family DNA-binding protein [Roseomonas oryzicola]|uniref:HU family DNA-binding protein n=1 Tax=Neoroseomonas oryzicola TaxID=535904 RepID=A0A9X9WHP4_9PROT|nr:HU family DNA-binding protein [Neoroseomonas oryzicola]NKE15706.1 HU family DNA-binding protein [Neoroseomonas oryzicola]